MSSSMYEIKSMYLINIIYEKIEQKVHSNHISAIKTHMPHPISI